jgi:hypothetical protein
VKIKRYIFHLLVQASRLIENMGIARMGETLMKGAIINRKLKLHRKRSLKARPKRS